MQIMDALLSFRQKYLSDKDLEWFIQFRSPKDIIKNHPTLLVCEIATYLIGFLTLVHALRNGGRYKWLWLATILHGLTVECVCYFVPDIENFWHAQSMVMLLGQRLPLHIIFLYPVFIYSASVAVLHMNLRWWAEPFAVGLSVVLLDVPFDIMGIKLLWWTWHDNDPNIFDRHYWVPWTSYYFHAAFASSFTLIFFGTRVILCGSLRKFQSAGFFCELPCAIVTGLFAMPLGILQFVPIYHPLHDTFGIHSEICVLLLIAVYALIVWSADRCPFVEARSSKSVSNSLEIRLGVLAHYLLYICLVLLSKPERMRSIGFHQPVGPCDETVAVKTPLGHILKKSKYLCTDAYYEDYFDFHCVQSPPTSGKEWYTICGTAFPNHVEYIIVVISMCVVGLYWYWQLLAHSGPLPSIKPFPTKHAKKD